MANTDLSPIEFLLQIIAKELRIARMDRDNLEAVPERYEAAKSIKELWERFDHYPDIKS